METNRKLIDWDALVNSVLVGNHGGNVEETKATKVGNFHPQNGPQKFPPENHLYPYAYKLQNGEGGIFLTRTTCLDEAQTKLKQRYGNDLALIVKAGTN